MERLLLLEGSGSLNAYFKEDTMRHSGSTIRRAPAALALVFSCACSGQTNGPSSQAQAGQSVGATSSGGSATATGGGDSGMATGGATNPTAGSGGASVAGSSVSGGESAGGAGRGGDAGASTAGGATSMGGSGGLAGTPSVGCNSQQVPTSGHFTLTVDGTEREYILKLPASYDVTRPTSYPLFVLLHGRMFSAQAVVDGMQPSMTGPYYGLEAASKGGAILVAAQALSTSWTNEGGRDVAYLNAIISQLETTACVDKTRVFGVGFSMGAIMTLTAGCDASSPFRAIAPMSANLPSVCNGAGKPLPYWGSHGTKDPTIDITQGEAVRDAFVKRNGCKSTSTAGDRAGCVNYEGCMAGAPVTWCTFEGVHEPPTFAGDAIWKFMAQF